MQDDWAVGELQAVAHDSHQRGRIVATEGVGEDDAGLRHVEKFRLAAVPPAPKFAGRCPNLCVD